MGNFGAWPKPPHSLSKALARFWSPALRTSRPGASLFGRSSAVVDNALVSAVTFWVTSSGLLR